MSPLWKVEAELCDYDQYDAFVVRAETEERAMALCHFDKHQGKVTATPIPIDGPEETILDSFNAG